MTRRDVLRFRVLFVLRGLVIFLIASGWVAAEPSPGSIAVFNRYAGEVEARLVQQHRSQSGFLVSPGPGVDVEGRLRRGEFVVEQITPAAGSSLPGALLHHWRGTAFAPGARAEDFERLMKDFNSYPQHFSPEVLQAKVVTQRDDRLQAFMRVRQQHVITVVMDTAYDVAFGRLDARHGYSISRSTHISEIKAPGTTAERGMGANEEHGFLWRLNTYWSYEERDGGLYVQIETVSLSRSIPRGLGWVVGPFVEKVPRESMEFTLRSACQALRK